VIGDIGVIAGALRVSVATQVRPHFTNRVLCEMSLISIVTGSTITRKMVIFRLNQSRARALGNSTRNAAMPAIPPLLGDKRRAESPFR
jgi:hypothetical protein